MKGSTIAKTRGGRPKKLTDSDKSRIIREAKGGEISSSGIVKSVKLSVTPRMVRHVLHNAPFLRYKTIARTPAMKPRHEKLGFNGHSNDATGQGVRGVVSCGFMNRSSTWMGQMA